MTTIKQPAESITFPYDFSDSLAPGVTIPSITLAQSTPRGSGANLSKGGQTISGGVVLVRWAGGDDGETYSTLVRVTDSAGDIHELDGEIVVREVAFVVPTIAAAPYLSSDEYVARFGKEETVRVTDEDRTGAVDAGKLQSALVDATEFAQAYVATRYTLPLPSVPSILKGIVADLARERLNKTRVLPAITENADRARAQLRDIAAGRMTLPVADGAPEPETHLSTGYAQTAPGLQGRVFNCETMAGF